jgi:hypothetical protein
MLMWKCDVCGKTGESPTSLGHLRLMPKDWRWREGRDLHNNGIQVHVCSTACAKRYDRAEAEQVGFAWMEPTTGETLKEAKRRAILPLKVK